METYRLPSLEDILAGMNPNQLDPSALESNQDPQMDAQELAERQEAAQALDEKHLVDLCYADVEYSRRATKGVREEWQALWDMSENKMDFGPKESWQSQISLDKPHATVQTAKAIIRKALVDTPHYWDCEAIGSDPRNELRCQFWKDVLGYWMGPNRLNVPVNFADASEMGLRIGQSHYMKLVPRMMDGVYSLQLHQVEPWKIYRDPDSLPRQNWSGMSIVHQDYVKWHVLKFGEEMGRYHGLDRLENDISDNSGAMNDGGNDKESIARRKAMFVGKHQFMKEMLTSERWGDIIDKKGELILPNATYTVGGNFVIRGPFHNPFMSQGNMQEALAVRWPMVGFSPIPHLLRFEGRGLLNGVQTLWKLMSQLLMLHIDNLNWNINKSYEVFLDGLVDPTDTERFPGKWYFKKVKERVIQEIAEKSNTADVLANLDAFDKFWQEFTSVTEFTGGLPQQDNRDRTARETEIKTNLSMGAFESIGKDLESGLVTFIQMLYEVLLTTWDMESMPNAADIFGPEAFDLAFIAGIMDPAEREKMLRMNSDISVTGVSSALSKQDQLNRARVIEQAMSNPQLTMAFNPYQVAKMIADSADAGNAGVLKDEEQYAEDLQLQAQMMEQQTQDDAVKQEEGKEADHQRGMEASASKESQKVGA